MKKIYDSRHQAFTICNWKKRGLKCREGETYKDIYYLVMCIDKCELCNVEFTDESKNLRCMDHDHSTGFFRKVLCNHCNSDYMKNVNKINHLWISPCINKNNKIPKNRRTGVSVTFQYKRVGFKRKTSLSLTKLIALSFINILKEPI